MTDLSGSQAHAGGLPISACPYAPGDPEGDDWRHAWIMAEAGARQHAGTFGASDQEYQAAGLTPPARNPRGVPVGIVSRAPVTAEEVRAIFEALRPAVEALNAFVTEVVPAALEQVAKVMRSIGDDAQAKPARRCPTHRAELVGGSCPLCLRRIRRRSR